MLSNVYVFADVFTSLNNIGIEFLGKIQTLGWICLALALATAGFSWIIGGSEGMRKAKVIIIGGIAGFILIVGANSIATYFKDTIAF
ncbi:hypothetical protein [Clostridium perfringens]|uniref:hypothetical protein n=1 Tax=Clostridium perfringens TaxID=1502 RepID=UPI0024BCECB4|nr:hypothetical protein [Clostridium perfringens]